MQNKYPKIAIIVLFYQDPQDVGDCLGSLSEIDYPEDRFDIVAIDNFSQNQELTHKLHQYAGKSILIETDKNLGYAGGNNLGINYALKNNFDYVYILNPDTQVEADFLTRAVELAESSEKNGIIQSKILLHDDRSKIQTSGNKIHYTGIGFSGNFNKPDETKNSFEIAYASGAGMLIKSEVLRKVGSFNEKYFMYHEDLDLGWLTRLYGYKILTEPKSVVYHKYEFSKNVGKFFWMERNRCWTIIKNYKLATVIVFAPAFVALEIMLLVYSILNGWFGFKIKSYRSFFLGLREILKQRKEVQRQRVVGDREILKHFEIKLEFDGMTEGLAVKFANVFFKVYFEIFGKIIFW
jgi:GT2 family glycosyltransferase